MSNNKMTGEEMVDVLKAAGWREMERIDPRPHDSDDYLLVLMRLERAEEKSQDCFVRLRSRWTSDERADHLNMRNREGWNVIPEELRWPVEIRDVMKFCS